MIEEINDMIILIKENPELFHDGINIDIVCLLNDIIEYIKEGK